MTTKKPRITAEQRKDWRNLPYDEWNVRSVHAYFADMNRELLGITEYLPMRNWSFEQGVIKRSLSEHGAELLKRAFDECFRTYRPTREYPLLTAGFAISYRINGLIPKLQAEADRKQKDETPLDYVELAGWL
ncbi:hypothetical protein MH117_09965 [Paenibacillus sp. ACRRX]|uniref:hypothetical protein n=1 Tax=Paenibacillus sp. ACRRX TaxID=2918206 RepID=UPI001EF41E18|nr:hypothetical protein [Paenibacillus sp. ACRRX]MCG7407749.1 hypothetical protein [Paenibacillus sp. ACRRX]